MGVDDVLQLPVGPELRQPRRVPSHARGDAFAGERRGGGAAPRRGRVHLEADGDELREPARSPHDHPGLQRAGPHRRARAALQVRSHRPPRRGRPLYLARRMPAVLQPAADGAAVGVAGDARGAPAQGVAGRTLPHPPGCAWVNYVRVHDDIGWTFDDAAAQRLGINGYDHRRFLNAFYTGKFPGTFARGLPFQENPRTGDARISGTCASLAGLEKALREEGGLLRQPEQIELAVSPHPADSRRDPVHRRHPPHLSGRRGRAR